MQCIVLNLNGNFSCFFSKFYFNLGKNTIKMMEYLKKYFRNIVFYFIFYKVGQGKVHKQEYCIIFHNTTFLFWNNMYNTKEERIQIISSRGLRLKRVLKDSELAKRKNCI